MKVVERLLNNRALEDHFVKYGTAVEHEALG